MSFIFNGSTSNSRVEYTSGITGSGYPMSIACWCYCTNDIDATLPAATYMNLVCVSDSTRLTYHMVQFGAASVAGNTRFRAATRTPATTPEVSATPSLGSLGKRWCHVAGIFRTASSGTTTPLNPSRWCRATIPEVNTQRGNNNSGRVVTSSIVDSVFGGTAGDLTREFQGYLAEVGIWNTTLTEDDILALSKGAKPTMVQPEYLVHYVPFVGNPNDIVFKQIPRLARGATGADIHPLRYG